MSTYKSQATHYFSVFAFVDNGFAWSTEEGIKSEKVLECIPS